MMTRGKTRREARREAAATSAPSAPSTPSAPFVPLAPLPALARRVKQRTGRGPQVVAPFRIEVRVKHQ